MLDHQMTVRSACSWHWMWSISENRYEYSSWWMISFCFISGLLYYTSLFFPSPRFRRWVFSQVTSPCSLLCWNWYRRQEISPQRSRRGPKPQWPWRGQIKSRVQNGSWYKCLQNTWLSICSRNGFMESCHPSTVLIAAISISQEKEHTKRWFNLW